MPCPCCGNEFIDGICPNCRFIEYEVLGESFDETVKQIDALAEVHRKEYLRSLQLGFVTYQGRDENGIVTQSAQKPVYFADGEALSEKEVWYPGFFSRIPDAKELRVELAVRSANAEKTIEVSVPNLTEKRLQQVGLKLCENLNVQILLKNEEKSSASEPVCVAIG